MSIEISDVVELWSTTLQLGRAQNIDRSDFTRIVRDAAVQRQERYTGFITLTSSIDGDTIINSFTRTRYPRKKYGVESIDTCTDGMLHLGNLFTKGVLWSDRPIEDFRVVFGLVEGYGREGRVHTVQEMRQRLMQERIEAAEIFAIRLSETGVGIYTEPAAIIRGGLDRLSAVHDLAEEFKQERYTVEDFSNRVTYTIETSHCTEPDAQF